jgi:hypothetical protein
VALEGLPDVSGGRGQAWSVPQIAPEPGDPLVRTGSRRIARRARWIRRCAAGGRAAALVVRTLGASFRSATPVRPVSRGHSTNVWVTLRDIRERIRTADDVALLAHAPLDLYDLLRAVEAVLALHDGVQIPGDRDGRFYCTGCPETPRGRVPWPCTTRTVLERALTGSEERV